MLMTDELFIALGFEMAGEYRRNGAKRWEHKEFYESDALWYSDRVNTLVVDAKPLTVEKVLEDISKCVRKKALNEFKQSVRDMFELAD